ncbi:MAG: RdgB/HAM1 family non-canonical purine NTP pyrophosphatase [bacterium]|jgi:XTP/dITP diphosphohydrolase|nr:RdgB/HAM1 family non-canonical purine NTP pyrophosphatase [bacterium]
MKKLIFATGNPGKLKEMKQILAELEIEVLSAADAGFTQEVVEDGMTFEENALKKARVVAEATGEWTIADDSGITINALAGRPGVYTARWAGPEANDQDLVSYTLEQLEDIPKGRRAASFHTVAALVGPNGEEHTFEGIIDGTIPLTPKGKMRPKLPYDVIFIPEEEMRTFAQMSDEEKNSLSHRGRAFAKLNAFLKTIA